MRIDEWVGERARSQKPAWRFAFLFVGRVVIVIFVVVVIVFVVVVRLDHLRMCVCIHHRNRNQVFELWVRASTPLVYRSKFWVLFQVRCGAVRCNATQHWGTSFGAMVFGSPACFLRSGLVC